jgi:hypothetical protein
MRVCEADSTAQSYETFETDFCAAPAILPALKITKILVSARELRDNQVEEIRAINRNYRSLLKIKGPAIPTLLYWGKHDTSYRLLE